MKLTKLSVAELQAMYREVVGRETQSSDSAYLVWKLRQAQKGRFRVGPIERRALGEAADVKVLPLRMTRSSRTHLRGVGAAHRALQRLPSAAPLARREPRRLLPVLYVRKAPRGAF